MDAPCHLSSSMSLVTASERSSIPMYWSNNAFVSFRRAFNL